MNRVDAMCADPTYHVSMTMRPGDMQFVNNYHVLHARTAYEDDRDAGPDPPPQAAVARDRGARRRRQARAVPAWAAPTAGGRARVAPSPRSTSERRRPPIRVHDVADRVVGRGATPRWWPTGRLPSPVGSSMALLRHGSKQSLRRSVRISRPPGRRPGWVPDAFRLDVAPSGPGRSGGTSDEASVRRFHAADPCFQADLPSARPSEETVRRCERAVHPMGVAFPHHVGKLS